MRGKVHVIPHFSHFTIFCDQTSQIYNIWDALSSCVDRFFNYKVCLIVIANSPTKNCLLFELYSAVSQLGLNRMEYFFSSIKKT